VSRVSRDAAKSDISSPLQAMM